MIVRCRAATVAGMVPMPTPRHPEEIQCQNDETTCTA
jgi:hypothetical protein